MEGVGGLHGWRWMFLLEAGPAHLSSASQSLFQAAVSKGRSHLGLSQGRFRMLGGTSNFWGGQLVPIGEHILAPRPWLGGGTAWPVIAADIAPFEKKVFSLLRMDAVLSDDEAVTVAGLVMHEAQAIPEPGQMYSFHGYRFHILRRTRNQITALRITKEKAVDEATH